MNRGVMEFKRALGTGALILSVLMPQNMAWSAPTSSAVAHKTGAKIDARCEKILRNMVATYKGSVSLSCNIKVDMTLNEKGEIKQAEPAKYIVSIAKPNRFSVELAATRGGKAVSNGGRVEYYYKPKDIYMIAKPESNLAMDFERDEFKLATAGLVNFSWVRELMAVDPYSEITAGVTSVQYAGTEKVANIDCDHLRLEQGSVTTNCWTSRGDKPLLVKVQPDLNRNKRSGANKISVSYLYSDQVFNKSMNDGRFEVAHPTGAHFVKEFFHEEGAELIGKPAPDVVLPMSDGTQVKLSNLKDRFVILDFWATWCPPCVASLPVFAKTAATFKPKGVVFIAVNKGESPVTAKTYLKANHINASLATDADGKLSEAFHVEGIPCTIFIGRDGVVKGVHVGINPNGLEKSFHEDLEKFISGKSLKRK